MRDEIVRRQAQRRAFMRRLYARTEANVNEFVHAAELTDGLDITPAEIPAMISYLEEKEWIMVDDHRAGVLRITALGIDHVEALEDD